MTSNQNPTSHQAIQETEQAVICALLVSPQHIPDVAGWLRPDMFETPSAALTYQAILAQYDRGQAPDFLTTETEMRQINSTLFEQTGGLSCLSEVLHRVRTATNLTAYAGEVKRHYLLRALRAAGSWTTGKASLTETDPLRLISELEAQLLNIRQSIQNGDPIRNLSEHIREALEIHTSRMDRKPGEFSICTGFREFDFITGGLQPGELYILGGRPADGKTAISLQIAANVANSGKKTGYFSFEMPGFQLVNRLLAGHTNLPHTNLRTSNLNDGDIEQIRRQIDYWKHKDFYLHYTPDATVENLRAQILMMKKQAGCDFIVIDYLQLINSPAQRGQTLDQVVGGNVRMLKQVACEAGCTLLVLSQMNRQSENRAENKHHPQLNDLRDSGVIEQVADGVIFVYRPDRHGITQDEQGNSLQGICQLILSKNRHGSTGKVNLRHNPSFTVFVN